MIGGEIDVSLSGSEVPWDDGARQVWRGTRRILGKEGSEIDGGRGGNGFRSHRRQATKNAKASSKSLRVMSSNTWSRSS